MRQFGSQQPDHSQVIGSFDFIDVSDCGTGDFVPQEAADSHGTGNGIRIRIDQNQYGVIARKLVIKSPQSFRRGNWHGS
jgi:hypothetical protein